MFQFTRNYPLIGAAAGLALSLFSPALAAPTQFDFNAPGSPTQAGWTAADLGNGSDGTISVATAAIGAVTVDTRDRAGTASDAGGGSEAAMWNDFVFANGSFSSAPDTGLQISISGLVPSSAYPITIWAYDDASNPSPAGAPRNADWSVDGTGEGGSLAFPDGDPTTLDDYRLDFTATSDAGGNIILSGIVSITNPSASHNVFVNGLEIGDIVSDLDGDGLPDSFEQAIIDADEADAINTIEDVLPGDDFDNDGSTNQEEFDRGTDPVDDDSDDDGALDGAEDGGGIWVSASQTGTNPLIPDTDGDGLLDGVENHDLPYDPANPTTQPGSDPNLRDTDGDGVSDGTEVNQDGTDPTDSADFLDPVGDTVAKFDFNAPGSPTQAGWTAADSGIGSDGTVSVSTEAIGGVTVDTRDRTNANTDGGGDVDNNDLWRDFVFANGSFDSAPDSGLRITLTGLQGQRIYPITIWAFDESSNANRSADWGPAGDPLETLTFPTEPDPTSLADYVITFEVATDASGQAVIEGIVAAVSPSPSHNVFVNALAIGQPTGKVGVQITDISYDNANGELNISWESKAGKLYNLRSESDPSATAPLEWPLFVQGATTYENLPGTPPSNTLILDFPPEALRLFVIEEFDAPPAYFEDFSSGVGGWSTSAGPGDSGNTAWDLDPADPGAGPPDGPNGSENFWSTNNGADYGEGSLILLTSPAINLDIAGATSATLSFDYWDDLNPPGDFCTVRIRDAVTTVQIGPDMLFDGFGFSWSTHVEDISAALGSSILIECEFTSDVDGTVFTGIGLGNFQIDVE